jgi:hypothetical protein
MSCNPFAFRRASCLLGVIAVLAMASQARATVFNSYPGPFAGPTVTYSNVVEGDSANPPPDPSRLFGTPNLSGDSLQFSQNNLPLGSGLNFRVDVGGAQPVLLKDGTLTMNIAATNSATGNITGFSIAEGGGYGVLGGTLATQVNAALQIPFNAAGYVGGLGITSINGVALAQIIPVPYTESFAQGPGSSGAFSATPSSITFSGQGSGTWSGSASFNIAAALAAAGKPANSRVTGLTLSLNNVLSGTAEPNSIAFIDKKSFSISTITTVPEPSTVILGLMGGVGLLVGGRRLRKAKVAQG